MRPAFNPFYHICPLGDEGVMYLSESGAGVLSGRLYTLIIPLIDGRRTVADIDRALGGAVSTAEVYYVIDQLRRRGFVIDADRPGVPAEEAFWHALGADGAAAAGRLQETPVTLRVIGGLDGEAYVRAFESAGLRLEESGALDVVITDDYLREELAAHNEQALAAGRPWLLARPNGLQVWLGPLFVPGETGCWRCLAHRLETNRQPERFLRRRLGHEGPIVTAIASLPAGRNAAADLIALEAAKWIGAGTSGVRGKVVTFDAGSLAREEHALVRRPQCPACGAPARYRGPRPVALAPRPKRFTADGGHRTVTPEQTLKRYLHHVSPITGVVPRLVNLAGGDETPVHHYIAGINFANVAQAADSLSLFRTHLRSFSAGKGESDEQAKAGCLAEAIERASGLFQEELDERRFASFRELGEEAIHPNACMLYSERQYRDREPINQRKSMYNWVPVPFDEEATIAWTPVWSLTYEVFKYLPTMFCYFGYRHGEPPFARACSNGNAAGNTIEEAIVQGFLELVERDAVAVWWYNRLSCPAVDLESFGNPYFLELREHYRSRGRDLWVLDIASDLGVPAFAAVSADNRQGGREILFGFGAHFDARLGVSRALNELNQGVGILSGIGAARQAASGAGVQVDPDLLEWLNTATLENQPYLLPARGEPERTPADFPRCESTDLLDDVRRCRSIVESRGMEMLVLDQTRPDIGMPVVKVIVPGLRHFWARFAPGRLYDVPVRMGRLAAPLAEESLNPVPMFI